MSHLNNYNGYWNMPVYPHAYHHTFPVAPPTAYPGLYRLDNYKPPVGLHFFWWGMQLAFDNEDTQTLMNYIRSGGSISGLANVLVKMGVIGAVAEIPIALTTALLAVEVASIALVNNLGGNKGVYFDIPYTSIAYAGLPVFAMTPKARY